MQGNTLTSTASTIGPRWIDARRNLSSVPHGVLNVNKPTGWTSHDVVMYLRRMLGIQKVGHAGTLDPLATGVLPVLVGKGTKIAQYLLDWEKEYDATLRLGQSTDTQDSTGSVLQESSVEELSEADIRSVVKQFHGIIRQIPPMYSAVKVNGQPLYKAARKGLSVSRTARTVTIHRLDLLGIRGRDVDLRVVCSKGTYIRTLCADIGDRLQVGGHLHWLQRIRVGPLLLSNALDAKDITKNVFDCGMKQVFLNLDEALQAFPELVVDEGSVEKVIQGSPLSRQIWDRQPNRKTNTISDGQILRIKDEQNHLLALGQVRNQSPAAMAGEPCLGIIKVFV